MHPDLEGFGTDQRHEQIDQQAGGHDSDKNVFHGSKLSARVRIHDAQNEKSDHHCHKDQVTHLCSPMLMSDDYHAPNQLAVKNRAGGIRK